MLVAVSFYFPSYDKDGDQINPYTGSQFISELADRMNGATIFPARGWWRDSDGDMRDEPVVVVNLAVPEEEVESLVELIHERLKGEFRQEAVYCEVGGVPSIR